jgi:hypothetical protein
MRSLTFTALCGNVLYVLWVLYNGIDDGFRDIASVQGVVLIGLMILLAINFILLLQTTWKHTGSAE